MDAEYEPSYCGGVPGTDDRPLGPDEYDIAGAVTGAVEAAALIGAHRVTDGDAVVALASSGLHANGYSLARHVFFDVTSWDVHRHVDELGRTLGEEMLEPTRIYDSKRVGSGSTLKGTQVVTLPIRGATDPPQWEPPVEQLDLDAAVRAIGSVKFPIPQNRSSTRSSATRESTVPSPFWP